MEEVEVETDLEWSQITEEGLRAKVLPADQPEDTWKELILPQIYLACQECLGSLEGR